MDDIDGRLGHKAWLEGRGHWGCVLEDHVFSQLVCSLSATWSFSLILHPFSLSPLPFSVIWLNEKDKPS